MIIKHYFKKVRFLNRINNRIILHIELRTMFDCKDALTFNKDASIDTLYTINYFKILYKILLFSITIIYQHDKATKTTAIKETLDVGKIQKNNMTL